MNKGVQQGSVLSPMLLNTYLEHFLKQNTDLNQAKKKDKVMAFADDILLTCDNKEY